MQLKVNKNFKSPLSDLEVKEGYEEIQKACTGAYKKYNKVNTQVCDLEKVRMIFRKYFNKEETLLDVNAPIPKTTFTPLMSVVWLGGVDEAEELLKLGASPCASPDHKSSPIHIAVSHGKVGITHLLLQNDPEAANFKNIFGATPLMFAAEAGNLEIVKILLETYKCNNQEVDNEGKTAIDYSIKSKKYNIEVFLRYQNMNKTLVNHNREEKKVNKI